MGRKDGIRIKNLSGMGQLIMDINPLRIGSEVYINEDVDVTEVHDCFSINGLLAVEDLGFAEKGKGGIAIEEGQTEIDGDFPINSSGGLKARGHPLGATGIAQAAEIIWQLRGEAGKRQVDGAEIGMTHNIGGTGGTAAVHIFGRDL